MAIVPLNEEIPLFLGLYKEMTNTMKTFKFRVKMWLVQNYGKLVWLFWHPIYTWLLLGQSLSWVPWECHPFLVWGFPAWHRLCAGSRFVIMRPWKYLEVRTKLPDRQLKAMWLPIWEKRWWQLLWPTMAGVCSREQLQGDVGYSWPSWILKSLNKFGSKTWNFL